MNNHVSEAAAALSSSGLALLLLACGGDPSAASAEPTFWQDVAPILEQKCTGCHQAGGIAPFALDDLQQVEPRASLIADVTESRVMPPYLMEVGGSCGSFDESQALTDDEIATIGAWARGERRAGAPGVISPRERPGLQSGTDLFTPLFTPQIEGGTLAEFDEYRCFEIELGSVDPMFVSGFEITPGNTALVHHGIAMLVDPEAPSYIDGLSNAGAIARLREADPNPGREGWSCFGEAGDGVRIEGAPAVWGPGLGAYTFPEGSGVRILPGRKLVVQLHYNLARAEVRGQSDQTRIRLQVVPEVERLATFLLHDDFLGTLFDGAPATLEPGNPAARYSWSVPTSALGIPAGLSVDVVSIVPHMHERGRKYTFEVGRDGAVECQGRIDAWNFNWQRIYSYAPHLTLDSESELRVSCEYDTRGDTAPVLPGWGTRNEMCELTLGVLLPPGYLL